LYDLERIITQISTSRHYLTLNTSETVRDTKLQWNTNSDLHTPYSRVSFRSDLDWQGNIQWRK